MSFLYSVASAFLINYFVLVIINFLPVRRKRLWTAIIVSAVDLGEIIIYISSIVHLYNSYTEADISSIIIMYLVEILAIFIAYLSVIGMIFGDVRLFKSRRLRKFEAKASGKDNKFRIIYSIILLAFGLALAILGLILAINYSNNNTFMISGIVAVVVGVIGIVFGLLFLFKQNDSKEHKANIMLLVKEGSNIRAFISNERISFTDAAPKLCELYILDDLGALITDDKHYIVKGIRIDKLDNSLLNDSKLYEAPIFEFGEALSKFEKFRKQKIVINAQKEIIKIINIK